ncbi:hypothetical protein [Streptomyces venezuelae]
MSWAWAREPARFLDGTVSFTQPQFCGGMFVLDGAYFSGSTVYFDGAEGPAPIGLLRGSGEPLPVGLEGVPTAWLSSAT